MAVRYLLYLSLALRIHNYQVNASKIKAYNYDTWEKPKPLNTEAWKQVGNSFTTELTKL